MFKTKHPKSNPQQQGRRKTGKPAFKYTGADAEFTDTEDDEPRKPTPALKETKLVKHERLGQLEKDMSEVVAVRQEAEWRGDVGDMSVDGDEVGGRAMGGEQNTGAMR